MPPRRTAVDLNEAIDEVIALVRGELSKRRVTVRKQLAERLPPVHADRVQLQQVMLNLILNAIEAMIGVDDDVRKVVISTESSAGEGIRVAVSDSGPGIAPEERSESSSPSTRPRLTDWELGCRSAAPSSMFMEGGCGRTRISLVALFSE